MNATAPGSSHRWSLIDSLRGFALFGILLVNSLDITGTGLTYLEAGGSPVPDPVRDILNLTVQTRFVPIFAFLFGMSLWFVLSSARERSRLPWLILVRRLVALVAIGAVLGLIYPGNIFIDYGIFGLMALPLILFTPAVVVLILGIVATTIAYALFGGGEPTTIGLVLLGSGAAGLGLPRVLEGGGRRLTIAFGVAVTAAVPALAWQATEPGDPRFTVGGITGVVLSVVYVTGFALLWRTPFRSALRAVFDPLGRMALSNYIGAAIALVLLGSVIDFGDLTTVTPVIVLSVGIIAAQSLLSRVWLARFQYGPVEWVWRSITWWKPVRRTLQPNLERI